MLGERSAVEGVVCKAVAIFLHYSYLTTFFCNNIMAWDIYKTFGQKTILSQIRSKRAHLPQYMVYAYGVPACIVAVSVTIEFSNIVPDFPIGYGLSGCWISVKSSSTTTRASPCGSSSSSLSSSTACRASSCSRCSWPMGGWWGCTSSWSGGWPTAGS